MRWMLDHGVADGATQPSFSTVDTWLLWTLTGGADGGVYATEPSNASRTMLMDLTSLDWSVPMLALFGVTPSMLADVRPSASRFGTVSLRRRARTRGRAHHRRPRRPAVGALRPSLLQSGLVKATYGTGAFVLANAGTSVPASSTVS